MPRAPDKAAHGQTSEMAIVDTFTRLIFGEQGELDALEERIIEALRLADPNLLGDSLEEMGDYLRAMGVREMIDLVAGVRDRIEFESTVSPVDRGRAAQDKLDLPPMVS